MQDELATSHPGLDIHLLGINMVGHESGVALMIDGHDIGLVQETAAHDVTGEWGAAWRDVFILDENNEVVAVYNLTANNLADQGNYDTLRDMLIAEATD